MGGQVNPPGFPRYLEASKVGKLKQGLISPFLANCCLS
jgi:hypothetical protein